MILKFFSKLKVIDYNNNNSSSYLQQSMNKVNNTYGNYQPAYNQIKPTNNISTTKPVS
jgi:hypothetical protein